MFLQPITPANLLASPALYLLAAAQTFALAYYLATVLQLHSYKFSRALLKCPRRWHLRGFVAPFALFALSCASGELAAPAAVVALYAAALAIWARAMDRRLVFTARIKRLFALLALFCAVFGWLHFRAQIDAHTLDALAAAFIASAALEGALNRRYLASAAREIAASRAKIVLITASFGKTSIKHFLADLLGSRAYFAPGSINTLAGLARDINENLRAKNPEIYIAEAGARERGDIAAIAKLLRPHVVIIGEIGSAHLEYFGSLARTKATKREALLSCRLERAFLHSSAAEEGDEERYGAVVYDELVTDVRADLEGVKWRMNDEEFAAPVLGKFNAANLAAAILAARALGTAAPNLRRIQPVAHRLQIIAREPKFIIDDGFNGNENGVLASYELAAQWPGRRVLATPGLVEVSAAANERLAAAAAEVFDEIIITARINAPVWQAALERAGACEKLTILREKSELQAVLAARTRAGDLVLFSNDAPNHL